MRRSGFTLIEMLTVMLLIITILAMGVPALFMADRKAWVSSAINELVKLHHHARHLQMVAAAQGLYDIYSIQITNPVSGTSKSPQAVLHVLKDLGGGSTKDYYVENVTDVALDPASSPAAARYTTSISGDDLVDNVQLWGGTDYTVLSFSWSYERQTGFIAATRRDMKFSAINGKYARVLKIHPLGFTEER